ncbi:MAG: hypothetical protein J1F02_01880 [Lachnospiraceae bacterium]|nr:hypothetical protein [Lachnospiraceae bacterium]
MSGQIKDMVNTKEDILRQIEKKARSYTPEWHFDREHPDIGTALAYVYASMMEGTLRRFAQIPMKNRIAFLNELEAGLLPALPSTGYVRFGLVNEEVEGVELPAGTGVAADVPESDTGQLQFETEEDFYVTPAVLYEIYQTCDRRDEICRIYQREDESKDFVPITLFSEDYPNLQEHRLYFSHKLLFSIQTEGSLQLEFTIPGEKRRSQAYLEQLLQPESAEFSYYSREGWQKFDRQELIEGGLLLHKGEEQPAFAEREIGGVENFWLRCQIYKQKPFERMRASRVRLSGKNRGILPDVVYGAGEERNIHEYLPFGERLDLYSEVYFGCQEVLAKKGAEITFSFGLDFVRIPLEGENSPIEWEWIMKKSDVKPNLEFDVTIEAVIWEYYNGSGWTRLFSDSAYEQAFSVKNGTSGRYQTITFTCPEDMMPVLVNASENFYIRARITKINNLYKMTGSYIIPLLGNTLFRYQYREGELPEYVVAENNRELSCMSGKDFFAGEAPLLFPQSGGDGMALYLGFKTAPVGSPVKMLFLTGDNGDHSGERLLWEYWNGTGWKNLNLVDETENFSKSGIVTFTGQPDIRKKRLFGDERYWLRIQDVDNIYMEENKRTLPVIRGIYMNAVAVRNVTGRRTEYFQMEVYQENIRFDLLEKNINDIEVSVQESGREEQLPEWLCWQQVEDFAESGSQDCHFVVDRTEGSLQFGDGRHGRVPPASRVQNIRVDYSFGGGEYTNLSRGEISRLNRSQGFIKEVENPEAMAGGCDVETLPQALARHSAMLRHQNRAVIPKDFEDLVLLASREVQLAKCYPGYDGSGRPLSGAVTLVVLRKDFLQGDGQFYKVKQQIMEYMRDKISTPLLDNNRFFVVEPLYVHLCVYAQLCVRDFNRVFAVKREVLHRLEQFFTPASLEDSSGWEIGTLPEPVQIQNAISDVPGIVYVQHMMLTAYTDGKTGRQEADMEKLRQNRYVLPVNGIHEIVITVETE